MFREKLPSSMLRSIVERVAEGLNEASRREPVGELQNRVRDAEPPRDFAGAISKSFGLIAEIKNKSPSMGPMKHRDVIAIAQTYAQSAAVRAISVLTNFVDFGMSVSDLHRVKGVVQQPILRKDFLFDPYQVWEARAFGADAILLMANVVTREGLTQLSELAESLGMAVLFELHEAKEIEKLPKGAKICGINSRRFMAGKRQSSAAYMLSRGLRMIGIRKDLSIDCAHFDLVRELPKGSIKVAESGVDASMVSYLRNQLHFDSLLVGTSLLMSDRSVGQALHKFEVQIQSNQIDLPIPPQRGLQHAGAYPPSAR